MWRSLVYFMPLPKRTKRLIEEWSKDFDLIRACQVLDWPHEGIELAETVRTLNQEEARAYLQECIQKREPASLREQLGKDLREQHRLFADEWVGSGHKTVPSYIKVYGDTTAKSARSNAWRILARDDVGAYVDALHAEQVEKARLNGAMVLKKIAAIAFSNIRDMIEFHDVTDDNGNVTGREFRVKDFSELTEEQTYAIHKITQKVNPRTGRTSLESVELYDKLKALSQLAKYFAVDLSPQELISRVRAMGYDLVSMYPELDGDDVPINQTQDTDSYEDADEDFLGTRDEGD